MRAASNTTARPQATKQSLTTKVENKPVVYKDINGDEVSMSLSLLNNVLAPGSNFTQYEAEAYFGMCQYLRLNPIKRECHLVKYGGKPTIVITRDCYNDRAKKCKEYQGKESGVCFIDKDGCYGERQGTILLPGEELLGAFCKVYMKDRRVPEYVTVSFDEAKRVKENGELQATWKSQPVWMCVKVAEARCLKAAIPEFFAGTFAAEELGMEETGAVAAPVDMNNVQDADYVPVDESTGEVQDEASFAESFFDQEG